MNQKKPLIVSHYDLESRKQALPFIPLLSSQNIGWERLDFDFYQYKSHEVPLHCSDRHLISITLDSIKTERKLDGVYQSEHQNSGSIAVIPAEVEHWVAWKKKNINFKKKNINFIVLSIPPHALAEIAPETINSDKVELLPTFAESKPNFLVSSIAIELKKQLEADSSGSSFYVEHLANALIAHLITRYCRIEHCWSRHYSLSPHKLKLAIEYINDNLDQKIKLDDVAQLLDISQFYFSHMFKESTGIPPYRYVIRQRVEKAKRLIKQNKLPLAKIALECGFTSQSQMTQHFRKCVGVTPKVYRSRLS